MLGFTYEIDELKRNMGLRVLLNMFMSVRIRFG